MIPAELLGLTYHPPGESPLPDYVLRRSQLEHQREMGQGQLEETGRHNRAEEGIQQRSSDITAERNRLMNSLNDRKLTHKLDAAKTKMWHEYNLARIKAKAMGDTVAEAQLAAAMEALEASGEEEAPAAPAGPAPIEAMPAAHFEPLSPFNYDFGAKGARVSTPAPLPEPPAAEVPSRNGVQQIELPEQRIGPETPSEGPPASYEDQYNAIVREGIGELGKGKKKQVIELPERPEDVMVSKLPTAIDPLDPLQAPIEGDVYRKEAENGPAQGPEMGQRFRTPGGGWMNASAEGANPKVMSVVDMYRARAAQADGAEKVGLEAAAEAASHEQTPEKANIAGERAFKNSLGQYRKTYPQGKGGGAGAGGQSEKEMDRDYKFDLSVAKDAEAVTKTARKGMEDSQRTIALLTQGARTGFKDRDALEAHLRSVVQTRINLQQLKMTQEAAGAFEHLENILNTVLKGGKFSDEYVRQMTDAARTAYNAAKTVLDDAQAGTDEFIRSRYRNRTPEEQQEHIRAVRSKVTGEVSAPSKKTGGGESREALEERARKLLEKAK